MDREIAEVWRGKRRYKRGESDSGRGLQVLARETGIIQRPLADTDKSVLSRILGLFKSGAAVASAPASLSEKFERARALTQQGQYAAAMATCQEMLLLRPDHFESLMLMSEIAARNGDAAHALEGYAKAIDLHPEHAPAHYKRGNLLKDRGELEGALASYERAIALDPGYSQAFCNRGVVLAYLHRPEAALDSYDRAIALNPNDALTYYNRGAVLRELEHPEAALAGYDQAIAVKPDYAEAHCNRGALLAELKCWDAALAGYDRAIDIHPGFSEAYFGRGVVFEGQKAWDAALASYERAIEINPDYADAHNNRGVVLMELRRWEDSLASLDRAIEIRPEFAEAYCNRGVLTSKLQRDQTALANFDRAIALKPDYADAFYNRADALINMKRFAAAIASYNQALALRPDFPFLLGMRRYAQMNICDWSDLQSDLERLTAGIETDQSVSPPFPLLALLDAAPLHHKAAQIWVREKHAVNGVLPSVRRLPAGDKIRIGYFSADFHDHPVALLMAGLFELHDRSTFHVTAFSFGPETQDKMRMRLEKGFDRFLDVRGKSDQDISTLARTMRIDIAVDLGGYTANSRPGIFAGGAAPVQVGYLGYLGTMGAPWMDYLVADSTIIHADERQHYTEKIIYLPSYQVNDSRRHIAVRTYDRRELGLPPAGFVFSCFNSNYKITPTTFAVWMRIIKRVEGSILFLYADSGAAGGNLRQEAQRHGVDAQRIVFGERLGFEDYLARLRTMDLFLDTLPYNAGTTASDALWAGLPVLTLTGHTFAGRVAASLLRAIDLPELITSTAGQYEDLAVELATNPSQLARIRRKLSANRLSTPLFDTQSFTKNLESAYRRICERYRANLPPEHIYPEV